MTGFTDCTLFSRLIQSPISISKATRFVHYSDNEYPCLFPVFLFPLQIFLMSALPVDAAFRRDLDNAVCHSFQNLVVVGRQNDYALEVHQTVIDSGDALQIEVVGMKGGKEQSYNPKLTAARVALAKTESEIEKLLDTLSGANPLLLQYANNRIEELDAERQKQLKLVADLTANSVSASQIDSITGYLDDWESVSFDDKRKVVDILISQIDATSESVTIHWKI